MISLKYKIGSYGFDLQINSLITANMIRRELRGQLDNISVNATGKIFLVSPRDVVPSFLLEKHTPVSAVSFPLREKASGELVYIITDPLDIYSCRWYMTNLAGQFIEKRGKCILVHGTTVVLNGNGVLIVGEKNSGKSSLAMGLVLWYGAKFITDDITFLFNDQNDISASGIFRGVNATSSTINLMRRGLISESDVKDCGLKNRLILKSSITEQECTIKYLIFPGIDKRRNVQRITPLYDIYSRLEKNLIYMRNDNIYEKRLDILKNISMQVNTGTIKAYECDFGYDLAKNCSRLAGEII